MKRKFSLSSLGLVSAFSSVSSLGDDENIPPAASTPSTDRQDFMLLDAHQDLVLIPYQKPALSSPEGSPAEGAVLIDSPPYSPSPSESERPTLSSRLEAQLRRSCAVIVRETNPSGSEFEDLPDHNETLRRLNEEHEKAQKLAAAAKARASKPQPHALLSRHTQVDVSEPSAKPVPYMHIPKNAAASFEATASRQQPLSSRKPSKIASDHPGRVKSGTNRNAQLDREDQLSKLRAAADTRPKNYAAACIDYTGPSVDTSSSTSRSTTTYGGYARPISTGLSSLAVTPGDEKPSSPGNEKPSPTDNIRVSEQILRDGPSASLADASARAWMAQELSRRRAECGNVRSTRPTARSSTQQKQAEPERPSSRAGAIASGLAGSVRDGIKDYIRPRHSTDDLRCTQSNKDLSRPGSSDGREARGAEKNWWRGSGLKRMESWNSFRNSKPNQEHGVGLELDEGPNLNRALPALPGLDQYKEKRETPKHISQLMRPGRQDVSRQVGVRKVREQTTVVPEDSYQQFLAQAERKKWQDSKRAVEAKMRHNALMASANIVVTPPKTRTQPSRRKPDPAPLPAPTVTVVEIPKAPTPTEKKPGLRKRLSRFWSHGSEKGIGDGSKGRGGMVAAN